MTLEERVDTLEAENARLLDLALHQAENNRRLLALAERQLAALQALAGIEPEPEPEPEPAEVRRACRATAPARRYQRAQGRAR